MTASHNLKTSHIGTGRHRILIGEHPDKVFIASSVDGASVGGFYTPDEVMEMACALVAAARVIRKRQRAG